MFDGKIDDMFHALNDLRHGQPLAPIAVLIAIGMLFCETSAQGAPKGGGIAKGSRNPIITKFTPALPKEILIPWNKSKDTWDDYQGEFRFTISDCGLGGLPVFNLTIGNKGIGDFLLKCDTVSGGGTAGPVTVKSGDKLNISDVAKGTGDYKLTITVKNLDLSADNSTTATGLTKEFTIEVDPTGLEPGLTKQFLKIAPIKVSRARKGTTDTNGTGGGGGNGGGKGGGNGGGNGGGTGAGQTKGRIHLRSKPEILGGSNKPSTSSTRISLRAGRTGGGNGGSSGGSGAAGGGNGGGGGQKGGAGGGSGGGGAAGGGGGAAGGGGGQKGGS